MLTATSFLLAMAAVFLLAAAILPGAVEKRIKRRLQDVASRGNPEERRAFEWLNTASEAAVGAAARAQLTAKIEARKKANPKLQGRLRQAGLTWTPLQFYVLSLLIGLLGVALARSTGGGILLSTLGGCLGLLPWLYVKRQIAVRLKRFEDTFADAIDIIVRGIKTGLPLGDCFKIIASESTEPIKSEFRAIIDDQAVGLPIEESVSKFATRVPLQEANFFAIVIAIQMRTGGNLAEALSNLSTVIRERHKLKRKVKALSSEATASAAIIASLPFVVGGLVYLIDPAYISLLFTETPGRVVLTVCAIWMTMGTLIMRKMIRFKF